MAGINRYSRNNPITQEWERVVLQDVVTLPEARRRFVRIEVTESP
jgi:hypothetical protein